MGRTRAQAERAALAENGLTYSLANSLTDLRLAIELAKPQLRMALLEPADWDYHVRRALAHLEGRD